MSENINMSNRFSKASKGGFQEGISQIESDLIFKKITKVSQGRMDFEQFFKSLIIIS